MEENGSAVRIYLPHSVPMPLCGEEAGIAYKYKVVGLGGPGLTREADWGGGGVGLRRKGRKVIGTRGNPKWRGIM